MHPYNLVSPAVRSSSRNSGCKNGICFKRVSYVPGQDLTVEFQHLGIQCVTRGKIGEALRQRQQIRVDPFGQGFDHTNGPTAVDLSAVRLCFQVQTMPDNVISPVFLAFVSIFCKVFLDFPKRKHSFPLPPVLSKPIFDARAKKELQVKIISKSSLEQNLVRSWIYRRRTHLQKEARRSSSFVKEWQGMTLWKVFFC